MKKKPKNLKLRSRYFSFSKKYQALISKYAKNSSKCTRYRSDHSRYAKVKVCYRHNSLSCKYP